MSSPKIPQPYANDLESTSALIEGFVVNFNQLIDGVSEYPISLEAFGKYAQLCLPGKFYDEFIECFRQHAPGGTTAISIMGYLMLEEKGRTEEVIDRERRRTMKSLFKQILQLADRQEPALMLRLLLHVRERVVEMLNS